MNVKKEEITIPILHDKNKIEKIRLYFEDMKENEIDDNYPEEDLIIEVNPKLKLYLKVFDPYIYRENKKLKLGGLKQLSYIKYDGHDMEIL